MTTLLNRHRLLLVTLMVGAACTPPDKPNPLPLGAGGSAGGEGPKLPLSVTAALDSGNSAMRIDDYASAVRLYRVAITGAPDHAAPWFGLYMAAKELKDSTLADSAMQQVRRLTNDAAVLPAHGEVAKVAMPSHTGGELPSGHPVPKKPTLPNAHP
jgi:hypothetical protein